MAREAASDNGALVEQLARLDGNRLRGYRENLAFYQGQQWPGTQRRRDRRLVFNYARALIDKTASYLMNGVRFVVDAEDGSESALAPARRAEQVLRDVYEQNNLAQLDFDSEIDVSVLGDGAWKVTWDPDQRRVRVTAPDVQGLYAWWLGDDLSRVWRVASRYQLSQEEALQLYGAAARTGSATSVGWSTGRAAAQKKQRWVVEGMDEGTLRAVAGRHVHRSQGQPVRLHPLRHLSEPPGTQAVLGRERRDGRERAGAGAEPGPVSALDDPGAVR
jgi:hypothetical protein